MKLYPLAILVLVGCGAAEQSKPVPTPEPRPETAITNEQVKEYYDEFMQLCSETGHQKCLTNAPKLKAIEIVDDKTLAEHITDTNTWIITKTVGLCAYSVNKRTKAIVYSNVYLLDNNGYGKNWYPEELRALVFHELGHCLLELDHPNPARPATDPAIMNYKMYQLKVYQTNWDSMVTELFIH